MLQILVFGSKSCGKTSFINSFIDGNREISCHNIEHGPFSHTVTESIYIEDGDLGDNEGAHVTLAGNHNLGKSLSAPERPLIPL